jgi:hypothetical protein
VVQEILRKTVKRKTSRVYLKSQGGFLPWKPEKLSRIYITGNILIDSSNASTEGIIYYSIPQVYHRNYLVYSNGITGISISVLHGE